MLRCKLSRDYSHIIMFHTRKYLLEAKNKATCLHLTYQLQQKTNSFTSNFFFPVACHGIQADCELVKIDMHCHIQGDVVLECIHLDKDLDGEEMVFRVMFNTAFIRSNILMLNRDQVDILWDAKDQFSKEFRAEVCVFVF